jgi:hypothetical protein
MFGFDQFPIAEYQRSGAQFQPPSSRPSQLEQSQNNWYDYSMYSLFCFDRLFVPIL